MNDLAVVIIYVTGAAVAALTMFLAIALFLSLIQIIF